MVFGAGVDVAPAASVGREISLHGDLGRRIHRNRAVGVMLVLKAGLVDDAVADQLRIADLHRLLGAGGAASLRGQRRIVAGVGIGACLIGVTYRQRVLRSHHGVDAGIDLPSCLWSG